MDRSPHAVSCLLTLLAAVALVGGVLPEPLPAADQIKHRVMEGVPMRVVNQRTAKRNKLLDELKIAPSAAAASRYLVVLEKRKWKTGKTITVAFNGGPIDLHADIARVASEWTNHGNIKLDFGRDQTTGKFRRWSSTDKKYSAEIRISFNDPDGGYWSVVGTESRDTAIVQPGQASMNLDGFDQEKPDGWEGIVRHEFGHALALEHEHQHPEEGCDNEWRWSDDPGYIVTVDQDKQYIPDKNGRYPGVYRVLGGPPNKWTKARVDSNLKQLPNSSAYKFGSFDNQSVMQYSFDHWMFKKGSQSSCYSAQSNDDFSTEDKKRFAEFYGRDQIALEVEAKKLSDELNTLKLQVLSSPYLSRQLEAASIQLK